ncbi:MAG: hypothetical protein ACTS73_08905 [Arsenophonus sp. NEOnobi-MAG3]
MLNCTLSTETSVYYILSSVTVIFHSELYRHVFPMLRLKCLMSEQGSAAATKYTSTASCYRFTYLKRIKVSKSCP